MPSDMLLFRKASDVSVGQQLFAWLHDTWPPSERIWLITGKTTGLTGVFEPDEHLDNIAEIEENFLVERYRLHRASDIPERAPVDAHWFRGAEYLPEEESTDGG